MFSLLSVLLHFPLPSQAKNALTAIRQYSQSPYLNKDSSITAATLLGNITEQAPYSYETESNNNIASAFILKDQVLCFQTAHYNDTLVIDPALAWSTYFGGSNIDWGQG
jgi:hypothetical protein